MRDEHLDKDRRWLLIQTLRAQLSICRVEEIRLGKNLEDPNTALAVKAAVIPHLKALHTQIRQIDHRLLKLACHSKLTRQRETTHGSVK